MAVGKVREAHWEGRGGSGRLRQRKREGKERVIRKEDGPDGDKDGNAQGEEKNAKEMEEERERDSGLGKVEWRVQWTRVEIFICIHIPMICIH